MKELSYLAVNSYGLGNNGLQLCDERSGYSSAYCASSSGCIGGFLSKCNPRQVWSGDKTSSTSANYYYMSKGYWYDNWNTMEYVNSVRCVADL